MKSIIDYLSQWDLIGFVIAGLISVALTLLIQYLLSIIVRKRKKYCISKKFVSASVYQNLDDDGLSVSVSYNGIPMDNPITVLKIRLSNDGEDDILFPRHFTNPIIITFDELDVISVSVLSHIDGVNPRLSINENSQYELTWDLLKSDEYFYLKIVVSGEVRDIKGIKFVFRAEGLDQIKSPEFKVRDMMILTIIFDVLLLVPAILFLPNDVFFFNSISLKLFTVFYFTIFTLLVLIWSLTKRIRWLKEE